MTAREGGLFRWEKKRKLSRQGSIFANASWGVVYSGSGSTDQAATPGFEGREVGICGHVRVGYAGEKKVTEPPGSNFVNTSRGVVHLRSWSTDGVVYTGV